MNGSEGGAGFYFRAGREVKAIREDFPPGKEERKKALNLSRHLYIWFTCKFYWVCLIYCLWATLSTIKRSIRRTRGLIEIMKNHFIF
ncbi:hypothetical protein V6N11_058257 [Hibiscus sabdariffa]|uniref:Uncharacterized protein n=1 Tax=Hibiscus sabdariffa TaxID=183260 RepID=A0ABR2NGS8_9ROSI